MVAWHLLKTGKVNVLTEMVTQECRGLLVLSILIVTGSIGFFFFFSPAGLLIPTQTVPVLTHTLFLFVCVSFCHCVTSEWSNYWRGDYDQRGTGVLGVGGARPGPTLERETEDGLSNDRNRFSKREREQECERERNMSLPTYSSRATSMTPLHFLKPWEKSALARTHTHTCLHTTQSELSLWYK